MNNTNYENPFFSIIINAYNSEKYLHETLKSVINQEFKNYELILWDNQSIDNTESIFKTFSNNNFYYYKSKKFTKLSQARNDAIKKANGQWIIFLDSDDLFNEQILLKYFQIIKNNHDDELGLIFSRANIINETNKNIKTFKCFNISSKNLFSKLVKYNFIPFQGACFKREFYLKVGGVNENLKQAEDYDILLKFAFDYHSIFVNEKLFSYRVHNSNLSNSQYELNFLEAIQILKKYNNIEAKNGLFAWHTFYSMYLFSKKNIKLSFLYFFKYGKIKYIFFYIYMSLTANIHKPNVKL